MALAKLIIIQLSRFLNSKATLNFDLYVAGQPFVSEQFVAVSLFACLYLQQGIHSKESAMCVTTGSKIDVQDSWRIQPMID